MHGTSAATIAILGEAVIDLIAGDDGAYRPHPGGSPYNVAIGLARQGMDVSFLSPFSDDPFGDQLHDLLLREGVRVPLVRRSTCPTSLSLITIDNEGLPTYRLYRQGVADKDTSFEEIKACLPGDLQVLHTGSLAITPSQLPRMRKLLDLVRERGVVVSMDINIRLRAAADTAAYLDGVRSMLPHADVVKASDEDLEPLGFATDPRTAAERAREAMGDGLLVLTEGSGGAVMYTPHGPIPATAYRVANVEDTVGAGDTFHAALLARLSASGALGAAGRDAARDVLTDALDYACAAAAINVTRAGCNPPTRDEVEAFRRDVPG
ncbi:MAG: PfkB family carbohydrate kinase [Woeseiaceae bacterium]